MPESFDFISGGDVLKRRYHLGDTAISTHTLQLQPFFGVGAYFWVAQPQSAKICLNLNFRGGGGGGYSWVVKL